MQRESVAAIVWAHKRQLIAVAVLIIVPVVSAVTAFILSGTDDASSTTQQFATSCTPIGTEDACIDLEVVREQDELQRGLSGRDSLAEDAGMLFDFAGEGTRCMWMPDMNFAIDIIWLNQDQEVVYVMSDITPETYPESFCGAEPARYVIEVNSGFTTEAGVEIGQVIEL